jgi:hypothetical protein
MYVEKYIAMGYVLSNPGGRAEAHIIGHYRNNDRLFWRRMVDLVEVAEDFESASVEEEAQMTTMLNYLRSFPSVRAHVTTNDVVWHTGEVTALMDQWATDPEFNTEREGDFILELCDRIRGTIASIHRDYIPPAAREPFIELIFEDGGRPALPAEVEPVDTPAINPGVGTFRENDHLFWRDIDELIELAAEYGPNSIADGNDLIQAMTLMRSYPSVRAHVPTNDAAWHTDQVMRLRSYWSRSPDSRTVVDEGRAIIRWRDTIRDIVSRPNVIVPPQVVLEPAQAPMDEPPWWSLIGLSAEEEIERRRLFNFLQENPEPVWGLQQAGPVEDIGEEVE